MNVLIVSNLYHPNIVGGAEKVAQNLAGALVDRGHNVAVATLNPHKRYEFSEVNGVRVHYLPVRNLYFSPLRKKRRPAIARALWHAVDSYNPFMAASLARVLETERPEVVNTHNIGGFSAAIWQAIKSRGIPLVHTTHDYYLMCPRGTMCSDGRNCAEPCFVCRTYTRPQRRLSRLVDVAVPVSMHVLDEHKRFGCFPRAEVTVINDRNNCRPMTQSTRRPRAPGRTLRFGYLGRLHPTKGTDLLVRSFLRLPPDEAELVIAGRGPETYESQLNRLADGHEGIRWLGFVSQESLLSQVDVLVVPSLWHDPSPLVVTEGMSHGLPIIGSRRGGIPELMGEGTGWVFDPDEPDALTRAMQLAMNSRNALPAMSERARERAAQFSIETMTDEYLAAYNLAIKKSTNPR